MVNHQWQIIEKTNAKSSIRTIEQPNDDRCDLAGVFLFGELCAYAHDELYHSRSAPSKFGRLEKFWQYLDLEKVLWKVVCLSNHIKLTFVTSAFASHTSSAYTNVLEELFPLRLALEPQILDPVAQLYQRSIKEGTTPFPLLEEVSSTQSGLGICRDQSLIARMHIQRYRFRGSDLFRPGERSVESFGDQNTIVVGINSGHRSALDTIPSSSGNFWRGIPTRIRYHTSVCLIYCQRLIIRPSVFDLHR